MWPEVARQKKKQGNGDCGIFRHKMRTPSQKRDGTGKKMTLGVTF